MKRHSVKCEAHAVINVVENIRDMVIESGNRSDWDSWGFRATAAQYLETGTVSCVCPVVSLTKSRCPDCTCEFGKDSGIHWTACASTPRWLRGYARESIEYALHGVGGTWTDYYGDSVPGYVSLSAGHNKEGEPLTARGMTR